VTEQRRAEIREQIGVLLDEYDRLLGLEEGEPRQDDTIITGWVVVYVGRKFEPDGETADALCSVRSDGMADWMVAGLLGTEAYSAKRGALGLPADGFDEP